jgi:hypothetical protein
VAVLLRRIENRFVGTQDAAEYSGIPAGTLRAWRCQGVGPKFYKPRGRALYDIADLDEFIRSGIRVSSVRKQGGTECLSTYGVMSGTTSST